MSLGYLVGCLAVCLATCSCDGMSPRERAETYGATASLSIQVVDDDGQPVTNSNYDVYFSLSIREGKTVKGVSGPHGIINVSGKTTGDVYVDVKKSGFYNSSKKIQLSCDEQREVRLGHWMPDVIMTNIVLRKIENPIPLLKVESVVSIPVTNTWLGFDMANKDFICPYGKGETSDWELLFQWDGKPQPNSEFYSLEFRSVGEGSGAYRYLRCDESDFPWEYQAKKDGYSPLRLHMFRSKAIRGYAREGFDECHPIVCRSRCAIAEKGEIVSANYSMISRLSCSAGWKNKGLLSISYYYNPNPNDRNLEGRNIYNTPNFRTIGGLPKE